MQRVETSLNCSWWYEPPQEYDQVLELFVVDLRRLIGEYLCGFASNYSLRYIHGAMYGLVDLVLHSFVFDGPSDCVEKLKMKEALIYPPNTPFSTLFVLGGVLETDTNGYVSITRHDCGFFKHGQLIEFYVLSLDVILQPVKFV